MKYKNRKVLLSLQFIPFVLTNGMNLFPVLVLAQVFLKYRDINKYVLPLILYFSFRTTVLFLARLKPIPSNQLLQISTVIGIVGSLFGSLYEVNLYFGLIAGSLLGICSGLLYPSYLSVQFHERHYNNFGISKKEQAYSVGFAAVFTIVLYWLMARSIAITFIYLALALLTILIIVSVYPHYQIEEEEETVSYPIIESFFLFVTGFFVIFIIKAESKLGMSGSMPLFFAFLLILIVAYFIYLGKTKPERKLSPLLTQVIIFKGMITNFILVFCSFYQLLIEGGVALYKIYFFYLIAVIIAPLLYGVLLKRIPEVTLIKIIFVGIIGSFLLIIFPTTFYFGVMTLSIFSSQLNLRLNNRVYHNTTLPRDLRLLGKYRLNNVGSVLQQLLMMFVLFIVTTVFGTVSMDDILQAYSYKSAEASAVFTLNIVKYLLVMMFISGLFYLRNKAKKETL